MTAGNRCGWGILIQTRVLVLAGSEVLREHDPDVDACYKHGKKGSNEQDARVEIPYDPGLNCGTMVAGMMVCLL